MYTELYLVRHGQPVLQNALLGATDSPLSELGWHQLQRTFECIPEIDHLISSSLSRCASFAQSYSHENQITLEIQELWCECFFGDWDGQTYQRLYREHEKQLTDFFADPDKNTPPNGESLSDFYQRVMQALTQLLKQHSGKKIVLLTHAGVIRTLVAWCLKMDYRTGLQFKNFAVDYAGITHLSFYHDDEKNNFQNESMNNSAEVIHDFVQLKNLNFSADVLLREGCT